MSKLNDNNTLTFNENVRILDDGCNEIRLRMGIWNYDDAGLDLSNESEGFKKCIRELFSKMENGHGITYDEIENYDISPYEKGNIIQLLKELKSAGVVCSEYERTSVHQITTSLLGNLYLDQGFDQEESGGANPLLTQNREKKLLFFSDNDYSIKTAASLSEEMEINVDIMDKAMFSELCSADLTTNIDAFTTVELMNKFKDRLRPYIACIGCLRHPSIMFIRNLNRVTWELEMPVTLSFIDGPFISMLSTTPPKTGCLECFELRSLSRMEDHVSYHRFVRSENNKRGIGKGAIPLLNLLTNLVMSEGFLINVLNASRFSGRVLNIYLPTFEIQVQDVLRAPFCHACGAVAKSKLEELNISSRVMIDEIVAKALHG